MGVTARSTNKARPLSFGHKLRKLRREAREREQARLESRRVRRARAHRAKPRRERLTRAVAKVLLALSRIPRALAALTRRSRGRGTERRGPSAHETHHTPLGRRSRQTNLTATPSSKRGRGQLELGFEHEEEPRESPERDASPAERDRSSPTPRSVPHEAGYMNDDARWAAKQHHFDAAGARTIHGNIASASRHNQGKRDHRGE